MMKKIGVGALCFLLLMAVLPFAALAEEKEQEAQTEQEHYIAYVTVEDALAEDSYYYNHLATLEMMNVLIEDEYNDGIFLYLNTPGGYMYETDELYLKLMRYKEKTGRKIYVYIGSQACSGGFYVAMAGDYIAAGRMSELGNVGLWTQTYSYAGLYDMLGIENEVIVTGDNKLEGHPTLTDGQRELVMARLEEGLGFFVQVIMDGREMTQEQARELTDGRIFTATQALDKGMIDAVLSYDDAKDNMQTFFGGKDLPLYGMRKVLFRSEEVLGEESSFDLGDDDKDDVRTEVDDEDEDGSVSTLFDWLLGDAAGGVLSVDGRIKALRHQ